MGVSFEELAQQKAYRQLTMTTEEGMARFIAFVEEFKKTGTAAGGSGSEPFKERAGEDRALGQEACCTADRCRSTGTVEPSQLYRCAV